MVAVPEAMGEQAEGRRVPGGQGDPVPDRRDRQPERPFVAILGGAKVSDKINVIKNLLGICDQVLIGGAMAYTFSLAQGGKVGDSLVEPDKVELAKELLDRGGEKLVLPVDTHCGDRFQRPTARSMMVAARRDSRRIPGPGHRPEDGRSRMRTWSKAPRRSSGTVRWACSRCRPSTPAPRPWPRRSPRARRTSIIGGGDSAAAIEQLGFADKVSHVSTGGGASLAMLEGQKFAAVDLLDEV